MLSGKEYKETGDKGGGRESRGSLARGNFCVGEKLDFLYLDEVSNYRVPEIIKMSDKLVKVISSEGRLIEIFDKMQLYTFTCICFLL